MNDPLARFDQIWLKITVFIVNGCIIKWLNLFNFVSEAAVAESSSTEAPETPAPETPATEKKKKKKKKKDVENGDSSAAAWVFLSGF